MPIYTFKKKESDEYIEITCRMSELDSKREELGDDWERVFDIPQIRTDKLSASFLDGVVPASKKKGFDAIKEANKLEMAAYNSKPAERKELLKEAKKAKEIKK